MDALYDRLLAEYDDAQYRYYKGIDEFIRYCANNSTKMYCGYDCAENGSEYETEVCISAQEIAGYGYDELKNLVVDRFYNGLLAKYGKDISYPTKDSAVWFDG